MPPNGGFWRRTLAYILDSIILQIGVSMVSFVVGLVMGVGMMSAGSDSELIAGISALTGGLLGLVGSWLYFALMESSAQQATVGKLALGLVVTDEQGGRISFGRATGRYFAKIISSLILFIGFFMIGWTSRKQGLHDMIAGTLVYKARNPRELITDADIFR